MSDVSSDRVSKEMKKAKKAEKKRVREAAEAASVAQQAKAEAIAKAERKAAKKAKKMAKEANGTAASPSPSPSPVSSPEPDVDADETERLKKEAKKAKKAAKKAKKDAERNANGSSSSPASSPSASPSSPSSSAQVAPASFPSNGSSASSASVVASPMTAGRKNQYVQHSSVASLSSSQIDAIRAEHKMTLTGNTYGKDALYAPVTDFSKAGFSKDMLECTKGFKAPTGIQSQCWPVLLMGRDAIAIAETGSGKTLGFVLPALVHILDSAPISSHKKGRDVSNMGPIALVLAPTRELAMQSAEVAEKASANVGLRTACIYGGADRFAQRSALSKGVHIVVATPGRLLSMMNDGDISLKRVTFLVLDEADRMLDLGFEPDVRAIVGACPDSSTRQTLMFSATWPESVQKLAKSFIVDPLRITIGKTAEELNSDTLAANKRIKQSVEVLDEFRRDARLLQIMAEHTKGDTKNHKKILVFVLYKKEVGKVERVLQSKGYNAVGMSSDKSQSDRIGAIESFKSGKVRLLVATDVAGRGLDINDIALVINYSFPLTIEDYVHRIGRTGRGGKSGEAITFFTKNDKGLSGELINVMREANANVPEELMKFGTGVKRKAHSMYGHHYKADDDRPMKAPTKIKFDD